MAKETRTGPVKITVTLAPSLRKRFNRHCDKMNVTVSQWLRDAMQKELTAAKALP